jgi:hypothetical protein
LARAVDDAKARDAARTEFADNAKAAAAEHDAARAVGQAKNQRLRELRMSRDAAAAQERAAHEAQKQRQATRAAREKAK